MRQSEPRCGRLCVLLLGLRVLLAFSDNLDATKRTVLRPSVRSLLVLRVLLAFSDPLDATERTALRPSVRTSLGLRV